LLQSAAQMEKACSSAATIAGNPGISIGALLGLAQQHGRDKVTFILSSSISSFGYWVEQLIAESTGKEGKGLIPVNGEEPGAPGVYGTDRVFIYMHLDKDDNAANDAKVKALEEAGHPVVRIAIADPLALGGEFYRWQVITATAAVLIGINPFDEPNVAESKKNTDNILEEWQQAGVFKKSEELYKEGDITVYGSEKMRKEIGTGEQSLGELIGAFTDLDNPHDYIALLPYFMLTDARTKILQQWRQQMRDDIHSATTLLNGPRYLHSTGQLHKGGPDSGLYIILTADEDGDLAIPGEKYGFATLHQAQALGDYRSLDDHGRRVIRIGLGKDIDKGLGTLWQSIQKSLTN
jgi:transaldolase/glucose-6-phosphate isomerase